jgi:hypothetical protein
VIGKMAIKEIKITEPQRNSLRVTLVILNRTIDEIEEICKVNRKNGIIYDVINDLNEQEINEIILKIKRIRKYLQYLVKRLNLKKEKYETRRIVRSKIASLWEIMCDTGSKRLLAYGEVDKSLKEILDPVIQKIVKILSE